MVAFLHKTMKRNPHDLSSLNRERRRNSINVTAFKEEMHSSSQIAGMHLQIRQRQEDTGENTFSNIMDSQEDLGNILAHYTEPGGQFLIAYSAEGEIVGFIGLQQRAPGKGVLKRLSVIEDFRGQGIGSTLVDQLIAWAKSNDYASILLATGEKERARAIYLRHGFQIIGYRQKNSDQESYDFLMHLEL